MQKKMGMLLSLLFLSASTAIMGASYPVDSGYNYYGNTAGQPYYTSEQGYYNQQAYPSSQQPYWEQQYSQSQPQYVNQQNYAVEQQPQANYQPQRQGRAKPSSYDNAPQNVRAAPSSCAGGSCPAPRQEAAQCPTCTPPCPAPYCEPLCKIPVQCKHPSSNTLRCFDFITVRATTPKMCILGNEYPFDFEVDACDDVCDVTVTTTLPEGVTIISSSPEATIEGRRVTWQFGPMNKCEKRCAHVQLRCECEGELCACFCATATPVRFCALLCAKPQLVCEKCGPCEACPGDPIHYKITVTNRGSTAAEDVVVTDTLPIEVNHSSCMKTLQYRLGNLAPCETKTIDICATAAKRGRACNIVHVTSCNADTVSCQWCTNISCCQVEIEKSGPKEVTIGQNADYEIIVTNTGDIPLTEVVVTDNAPSATSIVSAEGASINGNQAVWRVREIAPGSNATFHITLTTCTPGCFTNKVFVDNCQHCQACTEATTRWKGRPALNMCIVENADAICIGERTTYTISVVNQGSETDNNVVLVARFPKELKPLSALGDSKAEISGDTVTFKPYNGLRPRQTLTYRIDAEAVSSGDARVMVDVSSDGIKTPITQQESTIVN